MGWPRKFVVLAAPAFTGDLQATLGQSPTDRPWLSLEAHSYRPSSRSSLWPCPSSLQFGGAHPFDDRGQNRQIRLQAHSPSTLSGKLHAQRHEQPMLRSCYPRFEMLDFGGARATPRSSRREGNPAARAPEILVAPFASRGCTVEGNARFLRCGAGQHGVVLSKIAAKRASDGNLVFQPIVMRRQAAGSSPNV